MGLRENVTEARERLGWKRYRLAQESGLTATQIKEIEEGKNRNPGVDTIRKLSTALKVEPGVLLAGTSPDDLAEPGSIGIDHDSPRPLLTVTVPVEAVIVGGHVDESFEPKDETYELLRHHAGPGRKVIRIFGESMWPTYHSGDLLLVDTKAKVGEGQVGIVRVGGKSTVKRVFRKKKGGLLLKGDNPTFPVIEADADEDVEVLGKVLKIVEGERP
jgi:SOS-response transcriptional repressor LexA